jgi:hypothetical protein
MRNFIFVTLLVAATGCASARRSWQARYDTHPQVTPLWRSNTWTPSVPAPPPVDVSRSTESGPSGGAGVGPRAN